MQVRGIEILEDFKLQHAEVRSQIDTLVLQVKDAEWQRPEDVKKLLGSADFVGDDQAVINLKGTKYRLVMKVNYKNQLVLMKRIGTHAEYDKINANTI